MKFLSILQLFLVYTTMFSLGIFLIGLNETIRNETFNIVNTSLINVNNTPTEIFADYEEFKSTYIFTNQPFIDLMNFMGYVLFFFLGYKAWIMGRRSPPFKLNNVLISYSILLILGLYLITIIFEYLVDVFVNQLILLLFADIYNEIYMYKILISYFIPLLLFAYFLSWISNYIKYFDIMSGRQ